jgi:hypothetical protein
MNLIAFLFALLSALTVNAIRAFREFDGPTTLSVIFFAAGLGVWWSIQLFRAVGWIAHRFSSRS